MKGKMWEKGRSGRKEMEDGLSIAVSTLNLRPAPPNPVLSAIVTWCALSPKQATPANQPNRANLDHRYSPLRLPPPPDLSFSSMNPPRRSLGLPQRAYPPGLPTDAHRNLTRTAAQCAS